MADTPETTSALSGRGARLLAAVAAATVASPYYCQPVLTSVGRSLEVSAGDAGLVVVASLIGNAAAQLLVVPLVDRLERRRLAQAVLAAQLLGLLGMATAPTLAVAVAASVVIGMGASAAMVVLPYAVSLAAPTERGRATGTVMSGVLIGILLSRSLSGFLSEGFGWRTTYLLAAGLCVAAILVLGTMPRSRPDGSNTSYRRLVVSVVGLLREHRLIRRHATLGALGFVSFNLLWTGMTLLLSGPTYRFGDGLIGLFGLLGAAGALAARNAGRWHDAGHGRRTLGLGWLAIGTAWLLLITATGGSTPGLLALVTGIALLDVGMQAQHITNQSTLLTAHPSAAGRVTTAYMSATIIAGALGSALATRLYPVAGWPSLAVAGLVCSALAGALLVFPRRNGRRDEALQSTPDTATPVSTAEESRT